MEASSPHNPPTQDLRVQEEEEIGPQVRKIAPKKRIRYDSMGESNKKWKVDPLNTRAIQAEQERKEAEEEEEKRKHNEFL